MCRPIIACALTLLFILAPAAPRLVARQPAAPAFHDSTALPSGPVGARIRSFIETVNSGSVDRIKRFLREECTREFQQSASLDDHISATLGFSRDTRRHRLLLRPHLHARTPRHDRRHRQGPPSGFLVGNLLPFWRGSD